MSLPSRSTLRATNAFRLSLAALLFLALPLGLAPTASAHAALVSSDPAANSSLPTNPERVTATFNEDIQPAFAAMTVIGPDGGQWQDGEPTVEGPNVSVAVKPGSPAGEYTVNFRVTSADGHVISGSWPYTATEASAPPATTAAEAPGSTPAAEATADAPTEPAAEPSANSAMVVWPFVVGTAALIAGGALWAVRRRQ